MTYIANLGTDNVTWLATELDAPNGNRVATAYAGGYAEISDEGLAILRKLTEDEDGSITEDDEYGIQIWIEGTGYTLTPYTSGAYTISDAARELDVTPETITTLVGQIADDADCWDVDAQALTEGGLLILREQLASEDTGDVTLDELAEATEALAQAEAEADDARTRREETLEAREEARARRDAAIRAAIKQGHTKTAVAEAADISRQMLYRIID